MQNVGPVTRAVHQAVVDIFDIIGIPSGTSDALKADIFSGSPASRKVEVGCNHTVVRRTAPRAGVGKRILIQHPLAVAICRIVQPLFQFQIRKSRRPTLLIYQVEHFSLN